MYCYRINRRLFPEPVDPGAPCRLCGIPRDEKGPGTLVEPVQVRVSIPLSIMDPPHRYRIHRRKSFDASDTLALPRHCLLGWDILPPKSEKTSVPKSLDLWSSVSYGAGQRRDLSATSPPCQVGSRVCPNLGWESVQVGQILLRWGAQALTKVSHVTLTLLDTCSSLARKGACLQVAGGGEAITASHLSLGNLTIFSYSSVP